MGWSVWACSAQALQWAEVGGEDRQGSAPRILGIPVQGLVTATPAARASPFCRFAVLTRAPLTIPTATLP